MDKIKIENLSFTYPNASVKAISDINVEISKGEFFLVCGQSGCGKSTLLRMLKPALKPEGEKNGKISFFGSDIDFSDAKIGFVMQNPENQIVCDKV